MYFVFLQERSAIQQLEILAITSFTYHFDILGNSLHKIELMDLTIVFHYMTGFLLADAFGMYNTFFKLFIS